MNRRHFLKTSGLSLATILISDAVPGFGNTPQGQLINFPDAVTALVDGSMVTLAGKGQQTWSYQSVIVHLKNTGNSIAVTITAPGVKLSAVTLQWKTPVNTTSNVLNDHWERTYGDVSWHKPVGSEILP